ncbi:DUF3592 domain-containing protein [Kitasatospora sp. CB01950]|uniref:DUF3592 domain-containing protein n=1 Tax=Kitasatospora sp. CB01950 TaxID=1703930 RepID=UPI00093ABBD1|nr:DUF3592 domain-containing protein [Kitasatospora sp. CB01950]OKJ15830.1 hypothetical protein AMK19_06225 [Kitasatospora sp. CB01950]
MNDAGQTFGTFGTIFGIVFALIGLLFAVLGAGVVVIVLKRATRRRRVRTSGLVAEAEVLGAQLTRDAAGVRAPRNAVLGFRTADGQDVRIRDTSGNPRFVGDHVTVRYLPAHPREALPTDAVDSPGRRIVIGLAVAFFTVFALTGLGFAAVGVGFAVVAQHVPTDDQP